MFEPWGLFCCSGAIFPFYKKIKGVSTVEMNFLLAAAVIGGLALYLLNSNVTPQPYTGSQKLIGGAGAYMNPDAVPITSVGVSNGLTVYLAWDQTYTRMLRADGQSRYMGGDFSKTFDGTQWDQYARTGGPFSLQ